MVGRRGENKQERQAGGKDVRREIGKRIKKIEREDGWGKGRERETEKRKEEKKKDNRRLGLVGYTKSSDDFQMSQSQTPRVPQAAANMGCFRRPGPGWIAKSCIAHR